MKWIKASYKLPDNLNDLQIHFRHSENKMKLNGNFYKDNDELKFRNFPPNAEDYDILKPMFKYIEWLDESESAFENKIVQDEIEMWSLQCEELQKENAKLRMDQTYKKYYFK